MKNPNPDESISSQNDSQLSEDQNSNDPEEGSMVLEEHIDPNYVPTKEEIQNYAKFLGMDLRRDKKFLYLAEEGLKAPLPKD